jgi:hypothetical protein
MIWQAQGVKTLGRRNAKPAAYREVEEEYIQQSRTSPIENEAGDGVDAGEGRQEWRCRGSSRPM